MAEQYEQGAYNEALSGALEACRDTERICGARSADLAAALNNVAAIRYGLGQFREDFPCTAFPRHRC